MPVDARGELEDGRFDYQVRKDGSVVMTWYGQPVTTLAGKKAEQFLGKIEQVEGHAAQLLMARATGNFKRGNERQ